MAEEAATEANATSPLSQDHKRKLEDLVLESEARDSPEVTPPEPNDSNANSPSDAFTDTEVPAAGSPQAKRPRFEDKPGVGENGHYEKDADKPGQDDDPTEEKTEKLSVEDPLAVDAKDLGKEFQEIVNEEHAHRDTVQECNVQQPSDENLQPEAEKITEVVTQLQTGEAPQQGDASGKFMKDEKQQQAVGAPEQGDDFSAKLIEEEAQQQAGEAPQDRDDFSAKLREEETQQQAGEATLDGYDLSSKLTAKEAQQKTGVAYQESYAFSLVQQQSTFESHPTMRKMDVPNNKVGVLIGKAGETIKYLQYNSGAKIQITRDSDADPRLTTRPVELIGTLESINKAERLIKDVIAEADAGGSPSLVARGFTTAQTAATLEKIQLQVPNEKVGMIIGKGGETIKSLQTRSGARIQLIPQHLPEGDQSKERTVQVSGDQKQIEMAQEMIMEVMNQPARPTSHSGGFNQQPYRSRAPSGPPQWPPRGPHPAQPGPGAYDYYRGPYPQHQQNSSTGGYGGNYPPQHMVPRSNYGSGWEQRPPAAGMQGVIQPARPYDYYGGQAAASAPHSGSMPGPGPSPAPGMGPHCQVNYNYGYPQGQDYGQPTPYPQTMPPQQSYGQGYDEMKYENQAQMQQQSYGGHGNSQPGYQQPAAQPTYGPPPQQYGKPPSYGMLPTQGPPRTNQAGDVPYQAHMPPSAAQPYAQNMPPQQTYQYPSSGPMQQSYPPYGSHPVTDGYNQAAPASGAAYPQHGSQPVSGYSQPGQQQVPPASYAQGGYGAYPPSQQAYSDAANAAYGYQGQPQPDATYSGGGGGSAYGMPPGGQPGYAQHPAAQPGYAQPPVAQPGYDQSMAQAGGYGVPGSAPGGYVKSLSPQPQPQLQQQSQPQTQAQPQPGYPQYDSTQMYGVPR